MTAALSPRFDGDHEQQSAEIIELRPAPRWPRRIQAGAALLALPVAVALTAWFLGRPAGGDRQQTPAAAPVLRVEVVASATTTSVARRVAGVLSTETTEVSLLAPDDDAAATASATQVVYYDPALVDRAEEVQRRVGGGTLLLDPVLDHGSTDVTVVVGKDLAPA